MRKFFLASLLVILCGAGLTVHAQEAVNVPIVMYHLVTTRQKYIGKYGITPAELAQDLQYLADNGYNTVVVRDLIDFVNHGSPLPNKPVMLTFDDGNASDYEYLLPLLKKHNQKAVLAIIGKATDRCTDEMSKYPQAKHSNLTWAQVKALHESGHCEIQSHGYDMHGSNGSGKKSGESTAAYHTRLRKDLTRLQDACKQNISFTPTAFIYPLGVISEDSFAILQELGFQASFSCQEGKNAIKQGEPATLFRLKRTNRPAYRPIKNILDSLV
jgi:peptidoglycan/xylan/chitin deacetylase (PgdA/CDA1 family)